LQVADPEYLGERNLAVMIFIGALAAATEPALNCFDDIAAIDDRVGVQVARARHFQINDVVDRGGIAAQLEQIRRVRGDRKRSRADAVVWLGLEEPVAGGILDVECGEVVVDGKDVYAQDAVLTGVERKVVMVARVQGSAAERDGVIDAEQKRRG
jgi:hypothetical protein